MPEPEPALDHRDPVHATEIHGVLMAAYRVEEQILGVVDFAPLRRTVEHIRGTDAMFYGQRLGGRLVAVTEIEPAEHGGVHIGSMAVVPEWFRRGVATGLLQHVLALHHGRRVTVSTGAGNAPAIRLYEKLGFREIRRWATPREGIPMVTLARAPEAAG